MKKLFELLMTAALLLGLGACGGGEDKSTLPQDTTPASTTVDPRSFATARRIHSREDLTFDNEGKLIIEPGEVLVFFIYMDTFDPEVWQASNVIQIAWSAEAINHKASLGDTGQALRKNAASEGPFFTTRLDYGFGLTTSETWMLPESEYTAKYNALMAAAQRGARSYVHGIDA